MRKYRKSVIVFLIMFSVVLFAVYVNHSNVSAQSRESEKYERDYLSRVFDSENGLEGTTANCICTDSKGFLWFGAYTGLYRYDGSEFKKYLIDGRALPVKDIVEDGSGNLWIATNGDGLFRFDGENFSEYTLETAECGSMVVNKLYLDSEGIIWAGTKAGLFYIDTKESTQTATEYKKFSGEIIRDIAGNSKNEKIIIQKTGEVCFLKGKECTELKLELSEADGIPRCCTSGSDGTIYIGTTGKRILKISDSGEVLGGINGNGLSSFNNIYESKKNEFWVCSDTGIGILKNDHVSGIESAFDDSVEEMCEDYQGNYWFVSSRQGIMQMYEGNFADLGSYWGINETVNSIQIHQGQTYVGCDDELYCFDGKKRIQNQLTEACRGMRIRQIYLDEDDELWVSTYQNGIKVLNRNGKISTYSTENSGLEINQIRCIWQRKNKEVLIGTETGLYIISRNGIIKKFTENNILNTKRILDVKEDHAENIYVSTDGFGVYEIENETVKNVYSTKQGLLSDVVMKLVPSDDMGGVWIVTGEGICFIDKDGYVRQVTGIPAANSLDLLIENGKAVILAGNGVFQAKEEALLQESLSYTWFGRQDGLPVDFTANAGNIIKDGKVYMCGTTGVAGMNLNEEALEKPVRLYVDSFTEDGNEIETGNKKNILSPLAHRINIGVRMINFVHQNVYAGYCLEGMDDKETLTEDLDFNVSYTNLDGGPYTYIYRVYNRDSKKCISELTISFVKKYRFLEEPTVKALGMFLAAGCLILLFILLISLREKGMKHKYYLEFLHEKEEEISELAYKDLVTGVYNRNYFEHEKDNIDLKKMYALVSVSVSHVEYFKRKYGMIFMEDILRKAVKILQECTEEQIKICRISENIFYFWFMEPVQLENYIGDIKSTFHDLGEEEHTPYCFSVGAIYNNAVGKENMDELMERCGKMRILDEKHSEAKFIEGKMKML